jgi:hypothetical protein
MGRIVRLLAFLTLALVALGGDPSHAQSSFSSETRIKLHRAKLRSQILKSQDEDSKALEPCSSGNVDIGSIQVERGARVPSEITVVVDGDVINLNDGRGTHVCR